MTLRRYSRIIISSFLISFFIIPFSFSKTVYPKSKFRTVKKPSSLTLKSRFLKPEYAAFVMDADTGQVFETSAADALRHPASLTKMMTLYMLFKGLKSGQLRFDTHMPVSAHASSQAPSKLGLRPGETISVKHAILALVTKSANDVASVVAEYLGGTESNFGQKMTTQARSLGMRNTTFVNASGLPDPRQISTARDMGILSRALYKEFPQFFNHFKLKSFNYKGIDHRNHNHLLGTVEGVDGFKTGYTVASGSNLAATAVRYNLYNQPKRLIVVVLGGKNRHWRDAKVTELLERHYYQLGCKSNYNKLGQVTLTNLIHSTQSLYPKLETIKTITFKPTDSLRKEKLTVRRAQYQSPLNTRKVKEKNQSFLAREGLKQLIQKVNYAPLSKTKRLASLKKPNSRPLQPAGWIVPSPPLSKLK